MYRDRSHSEKPDVDDSPASRILRAARALLFKQYYSGLTMDALAHELGMSKKTLYAHFASKDAIIKAILETTGDTILKRAEALIQDPKRGFTQKLCGLLEVIGSQLGAFTPAFLRDLQRFAPHLHREIDDLRARNIPRILGGMLRIGLEEGIIRPDVDIPFVVEFWLQAVNALLQPEALDRMGLVPHMIFEKSLELFFIGVLTPKGRKDYQRDWPAERKAH